MQHRGDTGVGRLRCAIHPLDLFLSIGLVAFRQREHGEDSVVFINQSDFAAFLQTVGLRTRDLERDGNRPRYPAGEAHGVHHGAVIGLTEKAAQRRERADGNHFDIALGPLIELNLRQ